MVNQYKMQRIMGLGLAATVPAITTILTVALTKDIVVASLMGMAAIPLMAWAGGTFIKSPWRQMLEGEGVIVFDITSSGIIKPYIAHPNMPNVDIQVGKNYVRSIYNRSIGLYLKSPEPARMDDTGKTIKFELPKENYSKSYFALADKPILFWNSKLNTFLTKEVLAE